MPAIAVYILKIILCSGILFGYYWMALRNKIFHQYNRFYLLASVMLSLVLPFVQVNIWSAVNEDSAGTIRLLKVVTSGSGYLEEIIVTARSSQFTAGQVFQLLYISVSMAFLVAFIISILKIRKLYSGNQHTLIQDICLVQTNEKGTPFSFLKYIFWNSLIDINSSTGKQIFKHELAHVQHKHTHDKLFINVVLIFLWSNPVYWLIRKELSMIHEFIADKTAVENSDTSAFASMLLQAAYPQQKFELTNQFFYSPIKRRLIMLTKNKNSKAGYIGRVLVLPVLLFTFAAFSFKTNISSETLYTGKPVTIVINAGHGGTDFGAISTNGKVYEKDLALAISKKIKDLNANNNLQIVFTRDNDSYQSPKEIAQFANGQSPDLFISIHLNTAKKDVESYSGMNVFVAKNTFSNAAKSKLFASAIINQFSSNYPLPVSPNPQQREQGIWTLQEIKCPSVLIEAGYISNEKDLLYLQTEPAKENIAKNILMSIEQYATALNDNSTISEADDKQNVNSAVKIKDTTQVPPPLYFVDGTETDTAAVKLINPELIESMNVLTGEKAEKKYGEKGRNGVVLITTKKGAKANAQKKN